VIYNYSGDCILADVNMWI